ncbi:MAG TPA: polysaccharide biosynthesis tyrosine autokinase [Vicinamibacterales bacterium]|nr:polysaccharide biosynthesis tyrosine autokinase [Vicinamibacterales bacterium]
MSDDLPLPNPDVDVGRAQPRRVTSPAGHEGSEFGFQPEDVDAPVGQGFDPFYALRVLHKWRWIVTTVFILIVVGTAIHTYNIVPVYEARTRVLVEPERINILKIEDVVEQDRSIDAQIAVLQSRWLAKETMKTLGLLRPLQAPQIPSSIPAMRPTGIRAMWSDVKSRLASWGLPIEPAPTPLMLDASAAENGQISGFLAGLSVSSATKGVLDLRYRSADPVLAARIANGLAKQYIDENLQSHVSAVNEVNDWLAARMKEQREKVDAADRALQLFRDQNGIIAAAGAEDPAIAKLNELSAAQMRTHEDRLEKEAALNKARALRADTSSMLRLPQLMASSVGQQLRADIDRLQQQRAVMAEKLRDQHPEMLRNAAEIQAAQGKLQLEIDRTLDAMRDDVVAAENAEKSTDAAVEQQKAVALGQNRKGVQLGILERDAESSRQMYDMLVQRARETNIEKDIRPSEIRVLDPAEVPASPISPNVQQNMLLACFAGVVLAFGLAFGFEYLDSRIKTPDEIKTQLRLPLLGFVPEVIRRKEDERPIITGSVPSAFLEAVRSIRTNVLYSSADGAVKAIAVTSAGLSEGKTILASNLAVAIAQAGERVLLIDADMRRPTLHELFTLTREPGLSNLLVGDIQAKEGVQESGVPNLWILPSGHRPPNPPELLASQRFKKVIAAFADHFDWVLLDAPPVMPVTDACVLADDSTGIIFVVGAERVSRQIARRALEQLSNVNARVIGGVLTRVRLDRHRYYYAKYYHPRYGEYASIRSPDA